MAKPRSGFPLSSSARSANQARRVSLERHFSVALAWRLLLEKRRGPRRGGHPEWRPPWGLAPSVTVGARDRVQTRLNSTLMLGGCTDPRKSTVYLECQAWWDLVSVLALVFDLRADWSAVATP